MDVTRFSIGGLAEPSRAMGGSVSGHPSKTDRRLAALALAVNYPHKTSGIEFQKGPSMWQSATSTLPYCIHIGVACVCVCACPSETFMRECCTAQSLMSVVAIGEVLFLGTLCTTFSRDETGLVGWPIGTPTRLSFQKIAVCRLPDATENGNRPDPRDVIVDAGRL